MNRNTLIDLYKKQTQSMSKSFQKGSDEAVSQAGDMLARAGAPESRGGLKMAVCRTV